MIIKTSIHPTAEVSDAASIGDGCRIWQHCVIMDRARIGVRVKISRNVFIESGAIIGDGCVIKDNVSLFDGVTLENDVFVGPNVVFTNVLNPRAFINRKLEFKHTLVRRGATIGANATIICGNTIGSYAMIGAGAIVTKSIPDYALVTGNPARQTGWVSQAGHRLDHDLVCPQTGQRYAKSAAGLALA